MMRIVIDLQGAQSTGSRNRGIGRYSLALAQGIAKNRGEHEVFIALSYLFPDTIDPIFSAFEGLLPRKNICLWGAPTPINKFDEANRWRGEAAEHLREAFLASLDPDVIVVTSLFEGGGDDVATSIGTLGKHPPTAVVLYDLIPWIYQKPYLDNPRVRVWYEEKLQHLRRATQWLSISESSRQEGIQHLGLPQDAVVNISTAADPQFFRKDIAESEAHALRQKYGLTRPFLMYTGGIDHRKNIDGLIRAYATLSPDVRSTHQLAVVCSVQPHSRQMLEQLAEQCGLARNELVLTGFVPEEDLIVLYHLCKAFVFPSWHEGFGLPALEAMHCGAPVIAAGTSSLPEVVGHDEALFDPLDEQSMARKIMQVLMDGAFRQRLTDHAAQQVKNFSWDATAQSAIAALEKMHATQDRHSTKIVPPATSTQRPKLIFLSPLPPERSGIAGYSAELLPALAQYYDIEVVTVQKEVSDPWTKANLPIRTLDWFRQNAAACQRVIYQFGNSSFHEHMFDLLKEYPGVVVLHDFYLGHIQYHRDFTGRAPGCWKNELRHAHGFTASQSAVHPEKLRQMVFQYPCNWSVLEQATHVIVHSSHAQRLAKQWYGDRTAENWSLVPLLRVPADPGNKATARKALGFGDSDWVVASFGMLGSTKLNHELLDAWLASALAKNKKCHLIFAGENQHGEYGAQLEKKIASSGNKHIRISGWLDSNTYRQYLAASDMGVQLRTNSRGETSAAVLDCLNHGLPTVINANGSMADLPADAVYMLPDAFSTAELTAALEFLWQNPTQRQALSSQGSALVHTEHDPDACAARYFRAIEHAVRNPKNGKKRVLQAISEIQTPKTPTKIDLYAAAAALTCNLGNPAGRQLLLDVSTIIHSDAKSGIQRTVRSLLAALLSASAARMEVRPIYFDNASYRYANRLACTVSGLSLEGVRDDLVDFFDGDIYLALDLNIDWAAQMHAQHKGMRSRGMELFFVVYDILLLRRPDWWSPAMTPVFRQWLKLTSQVATGLLCISDAVAQDVSDWLQHNPPERDSSSLKIQSFHLGADMQDNTSSRGMPDTAMALLTELQTRTSFLMVGTIEPRKGHAQTLAAFDLLWQRGVQANLVIVGKIGWMVDSLQQQLREHPQAGKQLFWLEGISDEYLAQVYGAATCLLASSEGEGFGLPLIEAAQYQLPLLVRDLPVFREVAGEHAYYFNGLAPENLAAAIERWLALHANGEHPRSESMPWLTWDESAAQLLQCLLSPQQPCSSQKKDKNSIPAL